MSKSTGKQKKVSKCTTDWLYKEKTKSIFFFAPYHRLAKDQTGYNFDFRLLYKVLPRETAVVRFGGIKNEGKFLCAIQYRTLLNGKCT